MTRELANPCWQLEPLSSEELGPYSKFPRLSGDAKAALWDAHRARHAKRRPVTLGTNYRVVLQDRRINPEGLTFQRVFEEPLAMLLVSLRWRYLCTQRYHLFCDHPTELPDVWEVGADFHNVFDAALFGAPIHFHRDGVPETPVILGNGTKEAAFDVDIEHPEETPFLKAAQRMTTAMQEIAADATFMERPIRIRPYLPTGTDGPLTVAMNLRGPAILTDFRRDPDYVHRLFEWIVAAAIRRHQHLPALYGQPRPEEVWLADDSVAMLSTAQYREFVLPHHRTYFDTLDADHTRRRGMHLCGDATRHFPLLREECGVTCFDTGFPVDFNTIRDELGPDVELLGGVEVPVLLGGVPEQVYARAVEILRSPAATQGPFVLREANNLPPNAPWCNLAALYQAAFDVAAV